MIAKPRLAATVIVIDKETTPMQVLMIKRPEYLKAFGGFYAFPGGTIDELDIHSEDLLFYGESRDLLIEPAYYIAAAREMFEEVGLLTCVNRRGEMVKTEEDWPQLRQRILKKEMSFHQLLRERDWYVHTPSFHYFGHRITSLERPYRFNTRFFVVEMLKEQILQPNEEEIETTLWITPQEALKNYELNRMKLVPPTIQSLQTLAKASDQSLPQLPVINYTKEYY